MPPCVSTWLSPHCSQFLGDRAPSSGDGGVSPGSACLFSPCFGQAHSDSFTCLPVTVSRPLSGLSGPLGILSPVQCEQRLPPHTLFSVRFGPPARTAGFPPLQVPFSSDILESGLRNLRKSGQDIFIYLELWWSLSATPGSLLKQSLMSNVPGPGAGGARAMVATKADKDQSSESSWFSERW